MLRRMYQLFLLDKKTGKKCPFFKSDDEKQIKEVAEGFSHFYTVFVEEVEEEDQNENV